MANMLNSAKQAKNRALKILQETEPYVTGVTEEGKKLLYVLVESLKSSIDELNRAIGEIDNILPQYKKDEEKREATSRKKEMEDLSRRVEERLDVLKRYLH